MSVNSMPVNTNLASGLTPYTRLTQLDAIRGLAVLGIFLMNILFMGNSIDGYAATAPAAASDPLLALLSRLFFEGRFISLFTLLFGVGLFIQFERLNLAGNQPLEPTMRRLKMLMLIGFVHGLFIWPGDVLLGYGISAVLAIHYLSADLKHLKRRALQFIGVSFVTVSLGSFMLLDINLPTRGTEEFVTALSPWIGSYQEQLLQHLILQFSVILFALPLSLLWYTAGMMMLGIWLYRSGFFTEVLSRVNTLKLGLLALTMIGVDLWCHQSTNPYLKAISQVTVLYSAIPVALLYAVGIMRLMRNHPHRLAPLQRVGRLALSLYILQSIVGVLCFRYLFPEWLLEFDRIDYLLAALGFGVCQMLIATLYLKLARQGPLEWLWRRMVGHEASHSLPTPDSSNSPSHQG